MPATTTERSPDSEGTVTDEAFRITLSRLSKLSVEKHFDAYADIDWDAPEMRVEPGDPRWVPLAGDPVVATDWYRSLTDEERSAYALYRITSSMRTGWQFENLLQRGLLARAFGLPNGADEFRYVHHEIIEESQHTLMFQEVIGRSGLPVKGMPWWARVAGSLAVGATARWMPAAFFFLVLAGEEPVDYVQRRTIQAGHPHPLVERIMRIHVTEEARHVSFARHSLRRLVPRLHPLRRHLLAIELPLLIAAVADLMLATPPDLRAQCRMPASVAREVRRSPERRALMVESTRKIRELCHEVGLMSRPARTLWRAVGLMDSPREPT
jgi:P-aminobenzoate N-oxygenase AurF